MRLYGGLTLFADHSTIGLLTLTVFAPAASFAASCPTVFTASYEAAFAAAFSTAFATAFTAEFAAAFRALLMLLQN